MGIDWTHPNLRYLAFNSTAELEAHVRKVHATLMTPDGMVQGYLYQMQVELNRKLKEELKQCQQTIGK